ncbi:uncharacterized protein LOC102094985 isoform X2 [Columba livia]|uniref:uncharacterized protein LOC102094985 isoform X2 n=1 Tax=Columba livia TaxID=8932 RepID=UPI0031BA7EB5
MVRRLRILLDLFKSTSLSGHKFYREVEGLTHPLHPAFTLTTVHPFSHKRSSALLPFLLIPSQIHECWNFWTVHLFRHVEKDKTEIIRHCSEDKTPKVS